MYDTYNKEDKVVKITCSIGVAYTGDVGVNLDHLLECADSALYKAKENGRLMHKIYNV